MSIKGRNSVANLRKMTIYNPNVNLVNDNVYIQNLVSISLFVLKILNKNWILTSIKGRHSVANLWKMTIYNPNVILSMIMCIQNLVSISLFILKILKKKTEFWCQSRAVTLIIIIIIISVLEPVFLYRGLGFLTSLPRRRPLHSERFWGSAESISSFFLSFFITSSHDFLGLPDLFCTTTFSLRTSEIQPVLRSTCPKPSHSTCAEHHI